MRNWTPPATISSTTSPDPVAAAHPCLQRDKARNRRRLTPNLRHGLQRQWQRASGQRSRALQGHTRAPVLQDRNGTAGAATGVEPSAAHGHRRVGDAALPSQGRLTQPRPQQTMRKRRGISAPPPISHCPEGISCRSRFRLQRSSWERTHSYAQSALPFGNDRSSLATCAQEAEST